LCITLEMLFNFKRRYALVCYSFYLSTLFNISQQIVFQHQKSQFGFRSLLKLPLHNNYSIERFPFSRKIFGLTHATSSNKKNSKDCWENNYYSFGAFNTRINCKKEGEDGYRTLYPLPTLLSNGTLKLDSIHTLYYEEYGTTKNHSNSTDKVASKFDKTALTLHGGPGAGSFANHARFFNPSLYSRIILYDQRGCGRSTPLGETNLNTLHHLVMDIERLRTYLGVEKWQVILGGSWGSTLALAYAQAFPDHVASIALRGVCTLRSEEVDWLFGMENYEFRENGNQNILKHVGQLNQTVWESFQDAILPEKSADSYGDSKRKVLHSYYDCLLGENPLVRAHAAMAWFRWEMGVSSFSMPKWVEQDRHGTEAKLIVWDPSFGWSFRKANDDYSAISQDDLQAFKAAVKLRRWSSADEPLSEPSKVHNSTSPQKKFDIRDVNRSSPSILLQNTSRQMKDFIPAQAMLTCFYSVNNEFMLSDFQLLSKSCIDKIRHIPCIAIQGGNDLICPPDTALDLRNIWPEIELRIVCNGKHSMYDPPITAEIIKATDRLSVT